RVIADLPLPAGIKTSLDGKTLYVSDSYLRLWRAYPILPTGKLGPGKVLFEPTIPNRAGPDGLTLDENGTIYGTGRGGVWAIRPDGELLGFIPVPELCSNLTFGGRDGKTLFITCAKKVYSLEMKVRGGQFKK